MTIRFNSLSARLILCISLITVLIMSFHFWWNMERAKHRAELDLREKARVISTQFLAIRTLVALGQEQTSDYKHLNPVSLEETVNELFGREVGTTFKELCVNSKSPDNHPNSHEAFLMDKLNKDPSQTEAWGTAVIDGQHTFTYMIPIYTEESCLSCHNGDLMEKGITDIDIEGNIAGAISLNVPMKAYEDIVRTEAYVHFTVTSMLILFFITSVSVATNRMVAKPLFKLRQIIADMAEGNLNQTVSDIKGPAEITILAEEFKIMAEKLNEYYQELEQKVSARTHELSLAYKDLTGKQHNLEEANENLRKANKLKSEFLASVSHELKTPLTAIVAFNELLIEGDADKELQREFLFDIRRSSHQLLRYINDLLDMAKLEAGRMELEVTVFQLRDLVNEVVEQVSPIMLIKEQILFQLIPGNLPEVQADYRKIEQILGNLVGNAVKFTPNKGKITVSAEYKKDEKKIHLSVTDTGPGIKDEDKKIIFDAFRQVNGSSTREHKGSGLGLAISKKLVEMHQSKIWVESNYGYGSKFTFTIPIACEKNCEGSVHNESN